MPMVDESPGLDVSTLVRNVLGTDENLKPSKLAFRLTDHIRGFRGASFLYRDISEGVDNPYERVLRTDTGISLSRQFDADVTLDAISMLSLEVVYEYLSHWTARSILTDSARVLAVPGLPKERATILILDPDIREVSQSRRITDEIDWDPETLSLAFENLRPYLA